MSAPTCPFPVKWGRLAVYILFFFTKKSFNTTSKPQFTPAVILEQLAESE